MEAQPPEKPPDWGIAQNGGNKDANRKELQVFFRDKVLGDKQVPPMRECADLIKKKLVTIDYEGGNRLLPKVTLNEKVFQELCYPWQDALDVKLLGKKVGYNVMKDRLKKLWKQSGGLDIMDVDNGYYMVKFDLAQDQELAMTGGPWMIFDHYLVVTTWNLDFVAPDAKVERTLDQVSGSEFGILL